ncbi:AP-2 complex subunit sigma-like [Hibiscus syriacus]|uniref:AP-2 complex subunit sigma-like n=1 Tax=Hibiscus syriacus TaxID=106335 RepID=UPI00192448F5|nr:AP-2 complex subunit sigma-like [Hibiscus syriacus]
MKVVKRVKKEGCYIFREAGFKRLNVEMEQWEIGWEGSFVTWRSLHWNSILYLTVKSEGEADAAFMDLKREALFEHPRIRFVLLQNRQGKIRLAKYYVPLEDSEKHKVENEVHRLVVNRYPKFTFSLRFRTHKVIYWRYAGLFFCLCANITDNEFAYLESIHLFVEILDHFFSNVCELDLVFNFQKVYLILDEFILAGELQETRKKAIIERMGELEKLE